MCFVPNMYNLQIHYSQRQSLFFERVKWDEGNKWSRTYQRCIRDKETYHFRPDWLTWNDISINYWTNHGPKKSNFDPIWWLQSFHHSDEKLDRETNPTTKWLPPLPSATHTGETFDLLISSTIESKYNSFVGLDWWMDFVPRRKVIHFLKCGRQFWKENRLLLLQIQ